MSSGRRAGSLEISPTFSDEELGHDEYPDLHRNHTRPCIVPRCPDFHFPTSCQREPHVEVHAPGIKARKAVKEIASIADMKVVSGQTIYVPSYSSIYTSDRASTSYLAATLSIRNTDLTQPIVITSATVFRSGWCGRSRLPQETA